MGERKQARKYQLLEQHCLILTLQYFVISIKNAEV